MPTDIAIEIDHVSKRFKLYHNMITGPIKEILFFWKRKQYYKEFPAIEDVSLKIKRGEIAGIIGSNGAGKTTLLKCIAGLLPVNKGKITVNGKITALLALGVGIEPEFTGRENIYYNGILLGMDKNELNAKMDSIIEFAELGDYIDYPLRTYSSGMKARLLFSISMSVEPDILIVDEALATGDNYFVEKCKGRISELCQTGATIIFVSHNITQIKQLCERVILLDKGRIISEGEPDEQIRSYYSLIFEKEGKKAKTENKAEYLVLADSGKVKLKKARLLDARGKEKHNYYTSEKLSLEIFLEKSSLEKLDIRVFIGIEIHEQSKWVGEIDTSYFYDSDRRMLRDIKIPLEEKTVVRFEMSPLLLLNNTYSFWIMILAAGENNNYDQVLCEYKGITPFFVAREAYSHAKDAVFWQPCQVRVNNEII